MRTHHAAGSPGCRRRPLPALLACLLLLVGGPSPAKGAGSTANFSVDVPTGQSKSVKLNTLPQGTVVAVTVQTDGQVDVAFVNQEDFRNLRPTARPLFRGQLDTQMSFSVTIPAGGDYFLVFSNRQGNTSRAVTVTVKAEAGLSDARRAALERLKASERTLKAFEARLTLALIFKPIPIAIRACP
ncbi:MAG: hypothetical protein HZB35_12025, partial [Nitrospirae bacterium]|nr:hypothetical protein [Nitrospirota bacterium]